MPDFDFSQVTAEVTAEEQVPTITRERSKEHNPLQDQFKKATQRKGTWFSITLPGVRKIEKDKKGNEKIGYGSIVKKAEAYLRRASNESEYGIAIRHEADQKNGKVTLFFRAQDKRERKTKEQKLQEETQKIQEEAKTSSPTSLPSTVKTDKGKTDSKK